MATSPQWALIQPGIADFAKVVSYDRAGLGWSEQGPRPRDARTIARELHTALLNAGLPGPYLLVGASLGGPYATVFADTYRDETAGLVLVDSVHPDQLQRLPAQRSGLSALRIANQALPMLARLGSPIWSTSPDSSWPGFLRSSQQRLLPNSGRSRIGRGTGPQSGTRSPSGTKRWNRCGRLCTAPDSAPSH